MSETEILSYTDKLAYMANQIAAAFAAEGEEKQVADTADHIQKFWDPAMRRDLMALDAAKLKPAALKARALVKLPKS